jgi:hypothetical protein
VQLSNVLSKSGLNKSVIARRGVILGAGAFSAAAFSASARPTWLGGRPKPTAARPTPRPMLDVEPDHTPSVDTSPTALVTTAPALPRRALDPKGVIRKALLDDALVALKRHGDRISNRDHMFLVDFQRHSSQPRLYKLDLRTGEVQTFRTAHGRGSDPTRTGFAKRFSNTPNSDASSVGAYVTAGQNAGARDGANVILDGLDASNSQARARAVIVHGADYCEPGYLAKEGMLGRSNGCFALSHADLKALRPIMDSGRLIFAGN